ncbi:hypothetical protein ACWCWD_22650 [Streptomyces sp. NPDC001493]
MTETLTHFEPFPEPPPLILEYIAERSTEDSVAADGPAPWDLGALSAELTEPMTPWLDSVCRWLNRTYAWQPQQIIPPCWAKHGGLAYDIAALAFARGDAYADAGSSVIWHEHLDRFFTRMNKFLGLAANECRVGQHEDCPARFQLAAWPS